MKSYEKFEELCKRQGVTAYQISQKSKVATSTLSMWKQGKYVPKINKLRAIAKALNVSVEVFLEMED